MNITLDVPENFNFWPAVVSHGWSALPPFEAEEGCQHLGRILTLSDGTIVKVEIDQPSKGVLKIRSATGLNAGEKRELVAQVRTWLRMDEDFSGFYREASKHKSFRWISTIGAGRLLRAPTVFEDVVKMICTTNCSWALTEIMVGNLCRRLGQEHHDGSRTFPEPEAVAGSSEKYLRKEIRAGYRAPYLLELSRRIVKNEIDIEAWRKSNLPTGELFREVLSLKGVGPYAAGNILKLIGRYDYLGIDSWCRKKFTEIHRHGRKTSDKVIERHYEPFGEWRGLFFWLDMTKYWYDKKFLS